MRGGLIAAVSVVAVFATAQAWAQDTRQASVEPAAADEKKSGCADVSALVVNDYTNGITALSESAKTSLQSLARAAGEASCHLRVIGFAADRAARAERRGEVAIARTETVAEFLRESGVDAALLSVAVGGLTREFGDAAANRRVIVEPMPYAGRRCSAVTSSDLSLPEPIAITDFEPDVAALSKRAESMVDTFAGAIRTTDCRITVTGFSSPDGRPQDNEDLAGRRAARVFERLVAQGVGAARIDVYAVGSTREFGPKEANRRVMVTVQ